MKGMFTIVSKKLSNRGLLPRTISHAIGKPSSRSIIETTKAKMNEFIIAVFALPSKTGSWRMLPTVPPWERIPRIGGRSMRKKKKMIAIP
jgi:hypothetical protein